jgi:hypothetical protein
MASRFFQSCSPFAFVVIGLAVGCCAHSQGLLKPVQAGEPVMLLPSDMAVLEAAEPRKDLPCTVVQRKADLGFDLRFHSGYQVSIPLRELSGDSELLTVVFRAYPQDDKSHAAYFVQHFRVPVLEEEAKGDALLDGTIDLGQGKYHIDWLIRDRTERACSSSWDVEAVLPPKDKPMPLFINPNEIEESSPEPFINDPAAKPAPSEEGLNLKLLVNFAPQSTQSSSLLRTDTDALVSILKTIQRDPHVHHISLVAFNIGESRVIYRQEAAEQIDFPALGKAIQTMKLGTVDIGQLTQKHSETDFLQGLIEKEIGNSTHPDAVIFAGPKAMLNADVPQEELRRIGGIECPVFYMNYNLNPQAVPWKDSISHAIKPFKGVEYTISRPRDLWLSTSEMFNRIIRSKRQHNVASAVVMSSR